MAKETTKKKGSTKKTGTKTTKKVVAKKVDKNIDDTKDLIEEARERVLDEDRDILTSRVKKNELNYTQEIIDDIKEDDSSDLDYSRETESYEDSIDDDLYDNDERIINDDDASEIVKKIKNEEDTGDTNLYDFDFDEKRLKDVQSLDTSFVEGKVKSKELKEDLNKADKPIKTHSFGKVLGKIFLCIFFLLLGALLTYLYFRKDINKVKVKEKIVEKEVKVTDKNYVFLGDHVFSNYDLTKYISEDKVVNSSDEDDTSELLLKNIKNRVLVYNPSDVFISTGSNDYIKGLTNEEILTNLSGIIDEIKTNRSLSNIYVLSVLPVGKTSKSRNNETISNLNESIKALCEENEINYIDLYSLLIDEEGYLKEEYSKDGLNLNEEGYSVVTMTLSEFFE
ncbi:MAG: hypothetical protein IKE89_06240 [Bacilli bacterium]|nr:hypothetical protein [Bacilli bacterium]